MFSRGLLLCALLAVSFTACTTQDPTPTATLLPRTEAPTPTETSTPTPAPTPTPTPIPVHPPGRVIVHEADENTGFEWVSYLPSSASKDDTIYILVNGFQCCCPGGQANSTRGRLDEYAHYAETYEYVLLGPAVPKYCDSGLDEWSYHVPTYVFTTPPDHPYHRIDLKVSAMIDELTALLEEDGYTVHPRVFLFGYSIDSHFANRYSLLQPHRVQAFAAGGSSGEIHLPVEEIDGIPLNWRLGVHDFENLVGQPFQEEEYRRIPQLYFWGDQDLEHYHLEENGQYYWADYWGGNIVAALNNQCTFLQEQGFDATCKEYPGVGHEFTVQMHEDMFDFFQQSRD